VARQERRIGSRLTASDDDGDFCHSHSDSRLAAALLECVPISGPRTLKSSFVRRHGPHTGRKSSSYCARQRSIPAIVFRLHDTSPGPIFSFGRAVSIPGFFDAGARGVRYRRSSPDVGAGRGGASTTYVEVDAPEIRSWTAAPHFVFLISRPVAEQECGPALRPLLRPIEVREGKRSARLGGAWSRTLV